MRSLALLKCSWRNTCMGLWRRLWWGDRLNMQRWFIMEFLLFCQVLNTQGMSNLEVWISECLKHNEEVRIHLRKPLSNLPSPMGQYKFYFPFSGVENSRRCIFQHQTLVSTIHLRICCNRKKKKKKNLNRYQVIRSPASLHKRKRFCRMVNTSLGMCHLVACSTVLSLCMWAYLYVNICTTVITDLSIRTWTTPETFHLFHSPVK